MKKFLIIAVVILLALVGSYFAVIWYAMAHVAFEMTKLNTNFFGQQIAIYNARLNFDYESIRVSSEYLQPKLIIEKPHLMVRDGSDIHFLEFSHLDVIGSFWQSYQYHIVMPDTISFSSKSTPDRYFQIKLEAPPELEVISHVMREKQGEENPQLYYIDNYRMELPTRLNIAILEEGTQVAEKDFYTESYNTKGWQDISYVHGQQAVDFVRAMQQMIHGKSVE